MHSLSLQLFLGSVHTSDLKHVSATWCSYNVEVNENQLLPAGISFNHQTNNL